MPKSENEDSAASNEEVVTNIVFHPTLNVFIVVYKSHLRVLDARSGHVLYKTSRLIDDGDLHVLYSARADKLLVCGGSRVGVRCHYGGLLLLDTILQCGVQTEHSPVHLELTQSDASSLLQCLSHVGRPEHTCLLCSDRDLTDLTSQLRGGLEACTSATSQTEWLFVRVAAPWDVLHCLLGVILSDLLRSGRCREVHGCVSHVLYRVCRLARAGQVFEQCDKSHSVCSELERRLTFEHWPHTSYKWALPAPMAQAGLYHSPGLRHSDMVVCFVCSASLVMWEPGDEPWSEHERHSPSCPFVKGDSTDNISSTATESALPAQLWTGSVTKPSAARSELPAACFELPAAPVKPSTSPPAPALPAKPSALSAPLAAPTELTASSAKLPTAPAACVKLSDALAAPAELPAPFPSEQQLDCVSAMSSWQQLFAVGSSRARIAVWRADSAPQCLTDFVIDTAVLAELMPQSDRPAMTETTDPPSSDFQSEIKRADDVAVTLDGLCLLSSDDVTDAGRVMVVSAVRVRQPGDQRDETDQRCVRDSGETLLNILLIHSFKVPCSCQVCTECTSRHPVKPSPPLPSTKPGSVVEWDEVISSSVQSNTTELSRCHPLGAIKLPPWCQHMHVHQLLAVPGRGVLVLLKLSEERERSRTASSCVGDSVQPDLLVHHTAAAALLMLYRLSSAGKLGELPEAVSSEWSRDCQPVCARLLPAESLEKADCGSSCDQELKRQLLILLLSDGQLQLISADSLQLTSVLLQPGPGRVDFCYCDSSNCVVVCCSDGELIHVPLSSDLTGDVTHGTDIEEYTAMLCESTPDASLLLGVTQLLEVVECGLPFSAITASHWHQLSSDVLQRLGVQRELRQNMHVWRLKRDSTSQSSTHVFELTLLRPSLVACVELVFTVHPFTASIDSKVAYLLRVPTGSSRNRSDADDQVIDPALILDGPVSLSGCVDVSSHTGSVIFRCLELLQHQQQSLAVVICHKNAKNKCTERTGSSGSAECLQDVSIAILGHRDADTPSNRQKRMAVLRSRRFHHRLVGALCCQYEVYNSLLCQHLALGNLISIASVNQCNGVEEAESNDIAVVEVVQSKLYALIDACFVRGSRQLAIRFAQLLAICLQTSSFSAPLFESMVSFLSRLVEFKSSGGLRYFFVLFTDLARRQPVDRSAVAKCVSELVKIMDAWEKLSDSRLDLLNSRYGLNVSPFGSDTIDLKPGYWRGRVDSRPGPDSDVTDEGQSSQRAIGAGLEQLIPMCRYYSRLTDGQEMNGVIDVEPLHFTCRATSNLVSFTSSNSSASSTSTLPESNQPSDLWKHLMYPPAQYCGQMSQVHSGSRRFVTLDFHKPIILTDLMFPSCDMFSSIALHYWPCGDGAASVRLAFSTVIAHQHLQLSDLHPPPVCRFLKISLTLNGDAVSTSRLFHMGRYYGYTAVMPWQCDVFAECLRRVSLPEEVSVLETVADSAHFRLSQCRERLSAALQEEQYGDSVITGSARGIQQATASSGSDVPSLYHKCHSLRHQCAVITSLLERFRQCATSVHPTVPSPSATVSPSGTVSSTRPSASTASRIAAVPWSGSGRYQLLTGHLLEVLLGSCSCSNSCSKLRKLLAPDVCRRLLLLLCRVGVSQRLQWLGCTVLLRCHVTSSIPEGAGEGGWWPGFLSDVIVSMLAACCDRPSLDPERVFAMATILSHRVLSASPDTERVFLEALFRRLINLADVNHDSAVLDHLTLFLVFVSSLIDRYLTQALAARWRFVGGECVLLQPAVSEPPDPAGAAGGVGRGRTWRRRIMSQLKHCYTSIGGLNTLGSGVTNKTGGLSWRRSAIRLRRDPVASPARVSAPSGGAAGNSCGRPDTDEHVSCVLARETAELCCCRLLEVLLHRRRHCSDMLMMTGCKVMSWLTVSCRPVLHLTGIMSEEQLMSAFRIYTCSEHFSFAPWRSYSVFCLLQDLVLFGDRMVQASSDDPMTDDFDGFSASTDLAASGAEISQPKISKSAEQQSAAAIEQASAMLAFLPFASADAGSDDVESEIDVLPRDVQAEVDAEKPGDTSRVTLLDNECDVLDAVAICESLFNERSELFETLKKACRARTVKQKHDSTSEREPADAVFPVNLGHCVTSLFSSPVVSHAAALLARSRRRQQRTVMLNVCSLLSDTATVDPPVSNSASSDHLTILPPSISHATLCSSSATKLARCFLRQVETTGSNCESLQRLMELWLMLDCGVLTPSAVDERFCRQLLRLVARTLSVTSRTWAMLFDVLINSGRRRSLRPGCCSPCLTGMVIGESVLEDVLYKFLAIPPSISDSTITCGTEVKYGEPVCQRFDSLLQLLTELGSAGCWLLVRLLVRCLSSVQLCQLPADAVSVLLTRLLTADCACVCVPFGGEQRLLLVKLLHDVVSSLCRYLNDVTVDQQVIPAGSGTGRDSSLAVITAVLSLIISFCHAESRKCGGQTDEIDINKRMDQRVDIDPTDQSLTSLIWSDYDLVRELLECFSLLRSEADTTDSVSFDQMCIDSSTTDLASVSAAMCRLFRLMLQPERDHSQLLAALSNYLNTGFEMCRTPMSRELHCFLVQMIEQRPDFAQCLCSETTTELFSSLLDSCRTLPMSWSNPARLQRYDMLFSDSLSMLDSGPMQTTSSLSREKLLPLDGSDCIDISHYCEATCGHSPATILLQPGRHPRRYHSSWSYQFSDVTGTGGSSTSVPVLITLPFAAQLRQVHVVPLRDHDDLCPSAIGLELGPEPSCHAGTGSTTSGYSLPPVSLPLLSSCYKFVCLPVPRHLPPVTRFTLRVYRPREGNTVCLTLIRVLVSTPRCQIVSNSEQGLYSSHRTAHYMRRWLSLLESLLRVQSANSSFVTSLSHQLSESDYWPSLLQLSDTAASCLVLSLVRSLLSSSSSAGIRYQLLQQLVAYCNSCSQPYQLLLLYQLFVQLAVGDCEAAVSVLFDWLDRVVPDESEMRVVSERLSPGLLHCISACLWHSAETTSNTISSGSAVFFSRVQRVYECCLTSSHDVKLFASLRWLLCSLCHLCPGSFTKLVDDITVTSFQHVRGSSVQWSQDQLSVLLSPMRSPAVARLAVEGHLLLTILRQAVDCCYTVMDQYCGRHCDSSAFETAGGQTACSLSDTSSDSYCLYDRAASLLSVLASAAAECSICEWLSRQPVAALWLGLITRLVENSSARCDHSPPDQLLVAVCRLAAASCQHQDNQQLLAACFCQLLSASSSDQLPVFLRQLLLNFVLSEQRVMLQIDTNGCGDQLVSPAAAAAAAGPDCASWERLHPRYWDTHLLSLPDSVPVRSTTALLLKSSESTRRALASTKSPSRGFSPRVLCDWYRVLVQGTGPIGRAQKRAITNLRRQTSKILQNDKNTNSDSCVPPWDQFFAMADQYFLVDTRLSPCALPDHTTISQWLQCREQAGVSHCQHNLRLALRSKEDDVKELCLEVGGQRPSALSTLAAAGGLSLLAPSLQHFLVRQLGGCILHLPSLGSPSPEEAEAGGADDTWVKVGAEDDVANDVAMDESVVSDEGRSAEPVRAASSDRTVVFPPHCLPCFSLFLGLSGYSDLLMDHLPTARVLLRLALGDSDSADVTQYVSEELPLRPFLLMRQLLDQHPVDSDRGQLLRQGCFCSGLLHLLLSCVSALSHYSSSLSLLQTSHTAILTSLQSQWVCRLAGVPSSVPTPGSVLSGTAPSEPEPDGQYWAKGTGFGTGSTVQKWSADHALLQQRVEEEHLAQLLLLLASFLSSDESVSASASSADSACSADSISLTDQLPSLLSAAQIPTMLHALFRNDSVLDLAQHVPLYRAALRLVRAFAAYRQMACVLRSFVPLLTNLKSLVDTYSHHLSGSRGRTIPSSTTTTCSDAEMLTLTSDLASTCCLLAAVGSDDVITSSTSSSSSGGAQLDCTRAGGEGDLQQKYLHEMRTLQFGTFEMIVEQQGGGIRLVESHHYESLIRSTANSRSLPSRMKRLAQEAVTLSTSLPLSFCSSVFIRVDLSRLDVMKVLITGSADTPYSNGCFVFDVFFPSDYPQRPVLINLETTGRGTVRFNPNLYVDGKVCLSVLNTWHGRPEEKWNSQTSSLLQVLVSIQSLIIVAEPFFNEPGYERSRNTPSGLQSSREYDANIRQANVYWAMLQHLRTPPPCFSEVIKKHFYLKKDVILKEVGDWIAEQEAMDAATATDPIKVSTAQLKSYFAALKEELAQLKCAEEEHE